MVQDIAQTLNGAACGQELFPSAEHDLDRRQRPTHHDRRGYNDPSACSIADDERGADAQNSGLEGVTKCLRRSADIRFGVAHRDAVLDMRIVETAPRASEPSIHAERMDHFRIAPNFICKPPAAIRPMWYPPARRGVKLMNARPLLDSLR